MKRNLFALAFLLPIFTACGNNKAAEDFITAETELTTKTINAAEQETDEFADKTDSAAKKNENKDTYNLEDAGFWWADLEPSDLYYAIADSFLNKDKERIKSFLCEKTVKTHDLDTEIEALFDRMDGSITDYEKPANLNWSGAYSYRDGKMTAHNTGIHMPGLKTDTGKSYGVYFDLVDIGDDPSELGIHSFRFVEETGQFESEDLYEVGEYWE